MTHLFDFSLARTRSSLIRREFTLKNVETSESLTISERCCLCLRRLGFTHCGNGWFPSSPTHKCVQWAALFGCSNSSKIGQMLPRVPQHHCMTIITHFCLGFPSNSAGRTPERRYKLLKSKSYFLHTELRLDMCQAFNTVSAPLSVKVA